MLELEFSRLLRVCQCLEERSESGFRFGVVDICEPLENFLTDFQVLALDTDFVAN